MRQSHSHMVWKHSLNHLADWPSPIIDFSRYLFKGTCMSTRLSHLMIERALG